MKVLFIVKRRISYGVSYGLINSARFVVETLNKVIPEVTAQLVEVIDGNSIDREVHSFRPDVVIIEALWATPAKVSELARKYPHTQWVVRIHSDPVFIANEGIAMSWLTQYVQAGQAQGNISISSNDSEFADYLRTLFQRCSHTPNIYPEVWRDVPRKPRADDELHVGCFGALRPMKNHLTQAIAAISFMKHSRPRQQLFFHINADRLEQRGEEVLNNLRALFASQDKATLVEHNWLPHSEFLHVVARMDLGMQVSLTETFNIVAADFVSSGIPIVSCPDIDWVPVVYKANPNSLSDIESGIKRLLAIDNKIITDRAKTRLEEYNTSSIKAWKHMLKETTCTQ